MIRYTIQCTVSDAQVTVKAMRASCLTYDSWGHWEIYTIDYRFSGAVDRTFN